MYQRADVRPSRGHHQTLSVMRRLVDTGRRSPSVIARARDLTRHLEDYNSAQEIHAVHRYVRDRVRFTRDPWDVETLTDPRDMLLEIDHAGRAAEDCDSTVVLEASLLEALGHPTQFAVAAMDPTRSDPSHVWLEVRVDGEWVPLDPIAKNHEAGWIHDGLAGRYPTTTGGGAMDGLGFSTTADPSFWASGAGQATTPASSVAGEFQGIKTAAKWAVFGVVGWLAWKHIVRPITRR